MVHIAVLAIIFVLNMPLAVFAGSPPQEQAGIKAATASTMGVSTILDEAGRLWVGKLDDQQLLVSLSTDDGLTFSTPVAVMREPENISACTSCGSQTAMRGREYSIAACLAIACLLSWPWVILRHKRITSRWRQMERQWLSPGGNSMDFCTWQKDVFPR